MPLMGFFEQLELLVLLEGLADAAQPRLEALGHVDAHHHRGRPACSPSRIGTTAWIMSPLSSSWTVVISWPASAWRMCSWFVSRGRARDGPRPGFLTCTSSCPWRLKTVIGGDPEPLLLLGQVRRRAPRGALSSSSPSRSTTRAM